MQMTSALKKIISIHLGFNWRWRWWTARNEDVGQFREARAFRDTNWAKRVISFDDGDLAIFGRNPRQIFGRFCRWPWPGPRKTLTRCQRHGWKAAARAKIFLTDKSKFSSFFFAVKVAVRHEERTRRLMVVSLSCLENLTRTVQLN